MSKSPDWSIVERDVRSDDDAGAAFAALAWIQSQRKASESRCELQVARARQALAEACRIEIGETSFSFDEVEKSLESALCQYADAQRERLFANRRTARFDLGEIRIRKRSSSVTFAPGETAKTVLPRVEDPRYKRVKEELDIVAIKSDREKSLLSDERLAALGLVYDPGRDDISVHLDE